MSNIETPITHWAFVVLARRIGTAGGEPNRSGIVPVRPELVAGVRYFGRYRNGAIREGVLLSVG